MVRGRPRAHARGPARRPAAAGRGGGLGAATLLVAVLAIGGEGGVPAAAAAATAGVDPRVSGRYELPDRMPWAGEIFDLVLVWELERAAFRGLQGELTWPEEPLVAEPWSRPTLTTTPGRGAAERSQIRFRRRVMALAPGPVALAPAEQVFTLQTGTYAASDFQVAITEPVRARSGTATLEPRPLPPPPPDFSGAVGSFRFEARLEPARVAVGAPVRWTLTLTGEGNWPAVRGLPPRAVSDSFDVSGAPQRSDSGRSPFARALSETLVLVPRRAGAHALRSAEILVFDPRAGAYVRLRSPALTLEVEPRAAADVPVPTPVPEYMAAPAVETRSLLEGEGTADPPVPAAWLRGAALALPFGILLLWLGLAAARALERDPDRAARRAHRRIGRQLAALSRASRDDERRRLVREWQRTAGARWRLPLAAPVPAAFAGEPGWQALWADADVYLYSRRPSLPADWIARATAAWRQLPPLRPFRLRDVFRRSNLVPGCLLAAVVGLGLPVEPACAAASEYWRERVAQAPLDWRARHNLAVTLEEESKPAEAAAHAAIAWVQQPQVEDVRLLWTRLRRESGFASPGLGGPPALDDVRGAIAARAAPPFWQRLLLAALAVATCGGAAYLLAAYRGLPRALRHGGLALLSGALPAIAVAGVALGTYGPLGHAQAVVVWRDAPLRALPVDTFAELEPVHVAAGSVGAAERRFLGWWRVRLADDRSGWLRSEDLFWVWRSPPSSPGAVR